MIASILPEWVIDYGTDVVFIAAVVAAMVYIGKRIWAFVKEAREAVDDDDDA
jgi:hypothetical protein